MLDINFVVKQKDLLAAALENRGDSSVDIDRIVALEEQRKQTISSLEQLQHQRNTTSSSVKSAKDDGERQELIDTVKSIKERIAGLSAQLKETEEQRARLMSEIPNVPDDDVPVGSSEEDNVVYREGAEKRTFDFTALPHWEIPAGESLIEFERGVKLSGSRFYVLKSDLARLQRGLIAYLLHSHSEAGYTELYLPHIVRGSNLYNSGQLPKFESNLYRDVEEDYWLIPTAEVPITGFHSDEFLDGQLPLRYCSYTPCFRREKMSAGTDVKGMKRGHQFDKVELYKFVEPESSAEALQDMLDYVESICVALELPYRILQLCTGDLGFASSITYDFEFWAPGCGEWLEASSVSNCRDFQARRSNIKIKRSTGKKGSTFVHTLNGSAFGIPRTMIAILENYQQEDGSVAVPDVLVPFVGLDSIRPGDA